MSPEDLGEPTRSMKPVGTPPTSPQKDEGRESRQSASQAPLGGALLTVMGGHLDADYFVLTGEDALIGRSPDASVLLDDVTVSRQHAKITNEGSDWFISDLRSLNGTYLNRERVEKAKLADGDELQVGKFRFMFVLPGVTNG